LRNVAVLGAGFIGRGLLDWFGQRPDFRVVAICRRPAQAEELRAAGYSTLIAQLGDPALAERLSACDFVINAIRPAGRIPEWRATEERIAQLIASLPLHVAVAHLSTVSVYAQFYADASREFHDPSARTTHGRNKRWMELRLRRDWARRRRRLVLARVGHVWGKNQIWSHQICQRLVDPRTRLPLDGEVPSNTVHICTLGSALEAALLGEPEVVIGNAVEQPQWTWRRLFDFHADACGFPRVLGAEELLGRRYLEQRRYPFESPLPLRILRESVAWVGSVPRSFVRTCPSINEAVSRLLCSLGAEVLDERLRDATSASAELEGTALAPRMDYWMVGDAAPGPVLPGAFVLRPEDQRELGRWWSSRPALAASTSETRTQVAGS
jgi:nucleoside-diphosphate-sugar epimerase